MKRLSTGETQIVLEVVTVNRFPDFLQGSAGFPEERAERNQFGGWLRLPESRIEAQAGFQQAPQAIKRQVMIRLQKVAGFQKQVEQFFQLLPAEELTSEIEQLIPDLCGGDRKEVRNNLGGLNAPIRSWRGLDHRFFR